MPSKRRECPLLAASPSFFHFHVIETERNHWYCCHQVVVYPWVGEKPSQVAVKTCGSKVIKERLAVHVSSPSCNYQDATETFNSTIRLPFLSPKCQLVLVINPEYLGDMQA